MNAGKKGRLPWRRVLRCYFEQNCAMGVGLIRLYFMACVADDYWLAIPGASFLTVESAGDAEKDALGAQFPALVRAYFPVPRTLLFAFGATKENVKCLGFIHGLDTLRKEARFASRFVH